MLLYKINVLEKLKEKGYNTNTLRQQKILGEATIQNLRKNEPISWASIDKVCELLEIQIGELLEHKLK